MKTLALISLATLSFSLSIQAQTVDPQLYSGMKWRSIGPYRGGRSLAVAGSTQRPKEFFFGATGGGVWKTTDSGKTWANTSDGFFTTSSVGALAIAASNPDIVVAGTGERDIRGNISHGDGVYLSKDAGKTWSNIGLSETQTISRIVIHPSDPNIIYVAALGHVYGKSLDRGIYKTTNGGVSWSLVLKGTDRAGAVDISMDATDPNTLLAATWDGWRTPYSLNSGGDFSRIWKSTDGGKTWKDLTQNPGLPKGTIGKIGVSISPVDAKRYYASVEAAEGGIFRSDNAGNTWERVNDNRNYRQRAWYYSHVYADPKNRDGVYALNVGWGKSTDGGKTFSGMSSMHGDHHDLWVAPNDPKRMILADDGGGSVSEDGGKTWTELTFPTAQFYHVTTDNAFPYRILGAQQDNSTVRIASRTSGSGIGKDDWAPTAGGESGYIAPKPTDPDIVFGGSYGGDLSMINHRTGETRAVDPWPDQPMGHGAIDLVHRFQWTYPILFSPNNPNVLYTCSQFVLRSTNGGQTWRAISPDLTRNDPKTLQSSGGPITKDNTSVEYYGTVFTLAESPKRSSVIWAGSDDGLIHVTQNGGGTWKPVTPSGMPKLGLVSMIEASQFDPAVAYAAVDNHENDDLAPYIYRTSDYGQTWQKITRGIPGNSFVRVVREDRRVKGLLYAGTETGAWVSFNNGDNWQPLQMNLPNTPVHDLAWKDNDLIAATHGRAFWVLDDLTPIQQLAKDKSAGLRFFDPRDAYRVRWGGSVKGAGSNPESGVVLSYYLPAEAKEVKFEFIDGSGKVFMTRTGPTGKGFQRTSAFLQYPSYRSVPGMILWGAFASPLTAPPGDYTVRMTADKIVQTAKFRWLKDPRQSASDADLREQFRFARQVAGRMTEANDAVVVIRALRADLEEAAKKITAPALLKSIEDFNAAATKIEEAIYQTKNRSGQDPLNYPVRLNNKIASLFSTVAGGSFRPTDQSYAIFKGLSKELDVQLTALGKLTSTDLSALNKQLIALGIPEVKPKPPTGPIEAPAPRRRGSDPDEDSND